MFVLLATLTVLGPLLGGVACLGFGGPLIADTGEDAQTDTNTEGETDNLHPCGPTSGVVDYVIDGDTIVLESGERIRYILVNTPETTSGSNDCWGQQASDYNAMQVQGRTIDIEYDQECKDQYGRLLAYVSVDGFEVNRALLELGFACILHISPNGDSRITEYQALETAARQADVGMWGICEPEDISCDW